MEQNCLLANSRIIHFPDGCHIRAKGNSSKPSCLFDVHVYFGYGLHRGHLQFFSTTCNQDIGF